MKESDISYIAGLFDGEGSIYYKKSTEKKRNIKGKVTELLSRGVLTWKLL